MAAHGLFQKYESLNAHYPGERPQLGADVKCVQCDGCDRVITFAVFHSEYDGGVDVCNICRVAAEQSADDSVMCADHQRRLCFARHPLCFVGPAPLPERYEVDTEEVEVEGHPERLLARRFAKSVNVVARRGKTGRPPRRSSTGNGSLKNINNGNSNITSSHSKTQAEREARDDDESSEKRPRRGRGRPGAAAAAAAAAAATIITPSAETARATTEPKGAETPVNTPAPEPATPASPPVEVLQLSPQALPPATPPLPQSPPHDMPKELSPHDTPKILTPTSTQVATEDEVQKEGQVSSNDQTESLELSEGARARQVRLERIANGPVVRFFHHIQPGTKMAAERPTSVASQPLCVFDHENIKEFTVAPDKCCRTPQGFAGLTSCGSILRVRIVPTMPDVGLWFSVLCEEESCTRLDIWRCPINMGGGRNGKARSGAIATTASSSSSSSRFPIMSGALPTRKYSVYVGRHVGVSMDWLPVPLHRQDNNTLGLCTFIRGRYLVSTVLPRKVAVNSVAGCCANVAAEVCGATLLKRELDLVEVRWSSNGTVMAETFLFAIGRCTSVVVLQPTGDTRSGRLTLQVLHCIEAKGVAPLPPFVPSPPLAVGTARGGRTMLVMSHGASVACYQAPEFSTKLFVAVDDAVCAVQLHERVVTAGLVNGAVVNVSGGETVALLDFPPVLIDRGKSADGAAAAADNSEEAEEAMLVADTSGECTRVWQRRRQQRKQAVLETECVLALCRVRRGLGQRAALLMGGSSIDASLRNTNESVAQFTQHPLRHLLGVRGPLLAFYPDGAWLLAP
ncbi:hypothetical protein DQ04_06261030 [Trypanosoma grayi]|uniref:hypothetical protein n=1 Tax=Trypanosoma grayi TaxID=71804 RepID=UPI0004F47D8D|nr:hypothetical protein DQ04_06261030 [Trypanosoma grayi]KEG08879.1 hypothetical protein DQ04_06261030 [Trypanosoma grayi]